MLNQHAVIEDYNRPGWQPHGALREPRHENIHPDYFTAIDPPTNPIQVTRPTAPPQPFQHLRFLAVLTAMLLLLLLQLSTIQELRQTQSRITITPPTGNLLPPNVTYQALQAKFSNISAILSYLVTAAKTEPNSRPDYATQPQQVAPGYPGQSASTKTLESESLNLQRHLLPNFGLKPAVGIITVPAANLRTGPGREYPVVMRVSQGMRLVIEEYRDGWYSVTAPTGERVWVAGEVLYLSTN